MNNYELTLEYIKEHILPQMEELQRQHPQANIIYDVAKNRINITYPIPQDFMPKITGIKFER